MIIPTWTDFFFERSDECIQPINIGRALTFDARNELRRSGYAGMFKPIRWGGYDTVDKVLGVDS